jgi:hypothetical protein
MRKAKIFPKHDFNFNHFNNLALVKDRFSHCENTGPHDKIPA